MKRLTALALAVLLLLAACGQRVEPEVTTAAPTTTTAPSTTAPSTTAPSTTAPSTTAPSTTAPTADAGKIPRFTWLNSVYGEGMTPDERQTAAFTFGMDAYNPEDIMTFNYSTRTVFQGSEQLADDILENGKNPGLGVRGLHQRGIDGTGVNVAIIDQNLLPNHPEYANQLAAYYDTGCDVPEDMGSMHASAVLSLLAGESCGVAPGAKVWFAAAPSWTMDAQYYADALWWIIGENEKLPEGEKIRVVSVSAAPQSDGGWYTNGSKYEEAARAAGAAGIMVMDCRNAVYGTNFVFSAYYDPQAPDDVTLCTPGYPQGAWNGSADGEDYSSSFWYGTLFAPASYRTRAELYSPGADQYSYDGTGGQSWSVPYVAGVLALGWQLRPELHWLTMKELLFETACTESGAHVVDPVAFVAAVEAYQK